MNNNEQLMEDLIATNYYLLEALRNNNKKEVERLQNTLNVLIKNYLQDER
jgi:hypothetical protein